MLSRQIVKYIPSLVVPAIISFVAIYVYTRVLTPHEFGLYSLALSGSVFITAVFYYWLQTALPRLMPEAVREGRALPLQVTAYLAFAGVSILLCAGAFLYALLTQGGDVRTVMLFAVPMAIARALLNINQAFHRSYLRIGRYNVIECGQAFFGLAFGLALAVPLGLGAHGAVLGMIAGMAVMALVDIKTLLAVRLHNYEPRAMRDIAHFGLPMVATYGISVFLSVSDRFLVEHFWGAAVLGMYAAGYTLMDRIISMMFMMIATPSFPLTVNKLEHEGVEAARQQTYYNGVAVLALSLPACAGLLIAGEQLATLLIGPEFRAGALQVMPWIAVSAIMNGLATHYFDHAFYLAKKPHMLLFTQGPAAALNLVLNLVLIPRYGFMGAAYANVVAYALLLVLSASVGRRVFAIKFPFVPALQLSLATLVMAGVLHSIAFPLSLPGFAAMVTLGGGIYGAMVLLLNVEGSRSTLMRKLRK